MKLLNALKGISGEFEVQRVLGAVGALTYIFTGPALVWFGKVTATLDSFCIAYPAGIAAVLGASAGSIALKDRNVAAAKVVETTGSIPATPPAKPAGIPDQGAQG
jgi:hypothetical protein